MSSGTCGLSSSSSSIFGGLCSGNSRRPSMFTAKYRLREERKKVLKMSMAKVKRIEDPESFLRRSVLINNTIKRLQREVREEKILRHGGYTSKLSCSSFRKSFACSRLSDMHLPDDSLTMNPRPVSRNNYRKRPLSDDSEDDCDVQAVLNQIYIPPTPCIISSIDDDDCCDSTVDDLDHNSPLTKKAKMSLSPDPSSLLSSVTDECTLDVDVDVDVDVVGDSETSDWPTPPEPISLIVSSAIVSSVVDETTMDVVSSINSSNNCLSQPIDCIVGDSSDCKFSLDLPPRPPTSIQCKVSSANMSSSSMDTQHEEEDSSSQESQDVEDMTSSDSKENTCTLPLSSCCSTTTTLIPSSDRKTSNHTNHNSVNGNSVNSTSMSPPHHSTDTSQADKQYSSCGHSSIFGELQSVVFHSLITSLET